MRIGELARRSGVGVSTLRAWERRYRFLEPERSSAGHRQYSESDLERVEAVVRLLSDGLTLPAAIARVAAIGPRVLPKGEAELLLYGQILDAADRGVWVSRDGRTRYVNRRMVELMGYSHDELLVIPVLEFFDPDELPLVKERTTQVRRGEQLHFKQRLRRADGSTFLAEIDTTPLLNPAGVYEGAVSLVEDVTARAEAELERTMRAALLESVRDAVLAATTEGRIVYVNPAAEALFGWGAGDVVGRDGITLLAPSESAADAAQILTRLLEGKRATGTIVLVRHDGSTFAAQFVAKPVFGDDDTIVGLVTIINDRSERDELEAALRAGERHAETLAVLGMQTLQRASDGNASEVVVADALEAVRRVLGADQAAVIDAPADGTHLSLRAASPPLAPQPRLPRGSQSFAGYVALARHVVVLRDTDSDRRFGPYLHAATRSAIGAPIFGADGLRAVLTVESATPCQFDQDARHFIQGIANVIGFALHDHDGRDPR